MKFEIDTQLTTKLEAIDEKSDAIERLINTLKARQIRFHALTQTQENGRAWLRFASPDAKQAQCALAEMGLLATIEPVIAISLQESKGSLAVLTNLLMRSGVSVDYIYPIVEGDQSRLVLKVSNIALASHIMQEFDSAA